MNFYFLELIPFHIHTYLLCSCCSTMILERGDVMLLWRLHVLMIRRAHTYVQSTYYGVQSHWFPPFRYWDRERGDFIVQPFVAKPKINILSGYTFFFSSSSFTSICNHLGYDRHSTSLRTCACLTSMPFPLEAGFVTYQESETVFGSFRGLKDDFEGIGWDVEERLG